MSEFKQFVVKVKLIVRAPDKAMARLAIEEPLSDLEHVTLKRLKVKTKKVKHTDAQS